MFGLGEIVFFVSVITLMFGYRRIPKMGRYLMTTIKGFKEGSSQTRSRDVTPKK